MNSALRRGLWEAGSLPTMFQRGYKFKPNRVWKVSSQPKVADPEKMKKVAHVLWTWPPFKRVKDKPKLKNVIEKRKLRAQQYHEWREQVKMDLDQYTPPNLIDKLREVKQTGFEYKLSERFQLFSIKGTGPNEESAEDDVYSNIYTEHTDDIGVDPASPFLKFMIFLSNRSQVKCVVGDLVYLEQLPKFAVGDTIRFKKVLLVGTRHWTVYGRPAVVNASVTAVVEEHGKSGRVKRMKWRRASKGAWRKRWGFRQPFTRVRIEALDYEPPQAEDLEPLILPPVALGSGRLAEAILYDDRRR